MGLAAFDSAVHFFSLRAGGAGTPQMLVMGDVHDVFVPDSAPLLACVGDEGVREAMKGLLKQVGR